MSNNSLTTVPNTYMPAESRLIPSEHEFQVYQVMARNAAASQLYKGLGGEAQLMMVMLAARELGVPPMIALNGGIHCIQGKIEISARLMGSLIRQKGHSLVVKTLNEKECVIEGKRKDNGDTFTASFSYAEAEIAGLIRSGSNWNKYRKDMLFARAISRIGRQLFADVIGSSYVEGEIEVKGSRVNTPPDVPEDILEVKTTISPEQENEKILMFLNQYPPEDAAMIREYLEKRCSYYNQSICETICDCEKLSDEFFTHFSTWKNKHYPKNQDEQN